MFDIEDMPVITVTCDGCGFKFLVPSNTDYWIRCELEKVGWLVGDESRSFDSLLVCPACVECGLDLQTVLDGDFVDDWLEADPAHRVLWRDAHKRLQRRNDYRFCQGD